MLTDPAPEQSAPEIKLNDCSFTREKVDNLIAEAVAKRPVETEPITADAFLALHKIAPESEIAGVIKPLLSSNRLELRAERDVLRAAQGDLAQLVSEARSKLAPGSVDELSKDTKFQALSPAMQILDKYQMRGFAIGSALKYLTRAPQQEGKAQLLSLLKAESYVGWYVEALEGLVKRERAVRSEVITSSAWAGKLLDAKISELSAGLQQAGLKDFVIYGNGSMLTGHYAGPKQRSHSLNGDCPDKYNSVVEADIRIVLSKPSELADPNVIETIRRIAQAEPYTATVVDRWNIKWPTVFMYRYEDIADDVGLETEICVNAAPYVELAAYWKDVFNAEEINWQKAIRQALRRHEVDYDTEFAVLKRGFCEECKWRMVSAYALQRLKAAGSPDAVQLEIPAFASAPPPPLLQPLVEQWLLGVRGLEGLERGLAVIKDGAGLLEVAPGLVLAQESQARLAAAEPELLCPPTTPEWVKAAARLRA